MSRKTDDRSILFAHKAINLLDGLSGEAKRVGGAILDHFNPKTGQCDPSVERLARMLGCDRATIVRATNKLHDGKIITKTKHGGHSHRTAYVPNWELFNLMVVDWQGRMKTGGGPPTPCRPTGTPADTPAPKVAELPLSMSRNCDFDSRRTATQTSIINQSNKPAQPERHSAREEKPFSETFERPLRGLRNGSAGQDIAKTPIRPKVASSRKVAEDRAMVRWDADLRALGWEVHGAAVEHITETIMHDATLAEMRKRGGGIRVIMDQLGAKLLRGAAINGGKN